MRNADPPTFQDRLFAQRRELEDLLRRLSVALETSDEDEVRRSWVDFESRLLSHMKAEEEYANRQRDSLPRESEKLLEAHDLLRRTLVALRFAWARRESPSQVRVGARGMSPRVLQ